jgi:transcriptional regulator with XRE-family HTH domain
MSESIKQVAQRLRVLREISGETVQKIAKAMRVAEDEYIRYESGKQDIPVSLLYEAANYFKVELTALITGEEPRLAHYSLVRRGTGPSVKRRKEYKYQDLAYNFKHKKAEIFLVEAGPAKGKKKPHFNSHPGQEFNYCLEGTLKIYIGKSETILKPGDSLFFDSGMEHAMEAMDKKPAKFLAFII